MYYNIVRLIITILSSLQCKTVLMMVMMLNNKLKRYVIVLYYLNMYYYYYYRLEINIVNYTESIQNDLSSMLVKILIFENFKYTYLLWSAK